MPQLPDTRTRLTRRLALGASLTAATGLLAACGSSRGSTDSGTSAGGRASGESGAAAFPVTVAGKPRPATVKSKPRRVVACGYIRDTDVALALRAPLVGITGSVAFPGGTAPWQKVGSDVKVVKAGQNGAPVEAIAALRPDLILATDDFTIDKDQPKLSNLAPVLCPQVAVGAESWSTTARRVGKALGLSDRAESVIDDVQAQITAAKKKHPELAGKTFSFSPISSVSDLYTINSADDASAQFFTQLGMKLSPKVAHLPKAELTHRARFSAERIGELDADVVIITYTNASIRKEFEKGELFRKLPAVQRGAYVPLDLSTAISVGFPSVLSLPYGLGRVVPKVAAAAKKS